MPYDVVDYVEKGLVMDLVGGMLAAGLLDGSNQDVIDAVRSQLWRCTETSLSEPLTVVDGRRLLLCDGRVLPEGVRYAVVVSHSVMTASFVISVNDEHKEVSYATLPGCPWYVRSLYYCDKSVLDVLGLLVERTVLETADAESGSEPEDPNSGSWYGTGFTRDASRLFCTTAKLSPIVNILLGRDSCRALCTMCGFVVVVAGHRRRCQTSLRMRVVPMDDSVVESAALGDVLQKYHLLSIAKRISVSRAGTMLNGLFSNQRRRAYLVVAGESEVVERYGLTTGSGDRSWGLACEAEYQTDTDFRFRNMMYVCSVWCRWVVPDEVYNEVLMCVLD